MKRSYLCRHIVTLCVASLVMGCCVNQEKDRKSTSSQTSCDSVPFVSTPKQAIDRLIEGNDRFVSQTTIHPNISQHRRTETTSSQHPFAAIVACSDSRVPVEYIFDQGIGDLFVIRTAGNSVNDDVVMGSIDYAIDHLDVKVVVVLGHENCGGVTGAITTSDHDHHHAGKIGELLETIQEDVTEYIGKPEQITEAINCNTNAQVERIKNVKYISEKISKEKLIVIGAYYNVSNGKVSYSPLSK